MRIRCSSCVGELEDEFENIIIVIVMVYNHSLLVKSDGVQLLTIG